MTKEDELSKSMGKAGLKRQHDEDSDSDDDMQTLSNNVERNKAR